MRVSIFGLFLDVLGREYAYAKPVVFYVVHA
jgi:hypothetical protein